MRTRRTLALSVIALWAGTLHFFSYPAQAGTGCEDTGDDHGNCPERATQISEGDLIAGTFVPGNIESAGDVDVFSFDVDSSHTSKLFVIETSIPFEDPFSDTYVRLIDYDGSTEIVSDDNGGEGNASKLVWSPDESGTYYVEVSQFFPDDVGLYSVSVFRAGEAPEDDHANSTALATALIANGSPVSGSTELSADYDYFSFIAEASGLFDIETTSLSTGSDTVIDLIDRDGSTILASDDQGGREFNASRITWVAPSDVARPEDVYWVRVRQFLPSKYGEGYAIAIESMGAPDSLPLNGTEVPGNLEAAGDIEGFTLSATESHALTVDLATTNDINNFRLRLIDTDGVSLIEEKKNLEFEDLEYTFDEDGLFYLFVTEPSLGGAYSLSATSEAPVGNPDLNGDGKIDTQDFLILMESYRSEE